MKTLLFILCLGSSISIQTKTMNTYSSLPRFNDHFNPILIGDWINGLYTVTLCQDGKYAVYQFTK
jgi:hypothetical protein